MKDIVLGCLMFAAGLCLGIAAMWPTHLRQALPIEMTEPQLGRELRQLRFKIQDGFGSEIDTIRLDNIKHSLRAIDEAKHHL